MMSKYITFLFAVIGVCFALPLNANASVLNFGITYDGVSQSLDVGSDAMAGTTLNVNDGFQLDFHAAANDYWVSSGGNGSIYLGFYVLDGANRTYNSTATFYRNGVQVAQDVDLNQTQSSVHVGAQGFSVANGQEFDQIILDYTLLAETGSFTTFQEDYARFNFLNNSSFASYQSGVPEPTTVMIWSLLGGCAFLGRRRS